MTWIFWCSEFWRCERWLCAPFFSPHSKITSCQKKYQNICAVQNNTVWFFLTYGLYLQKTTWREYFDALSFWRCERRLCAPFFFSLFLFFSSLFFSFSWNTIQSFFWILSHFFSFFDFCSFLVKNENYPFFSISIIIDFWPFLFTLPNYPFLPF